MSREVDAWGRVQFTGDDVVELLMRGYDLGDIPVRFDASIERYNDMCRMHNKDEYAVVPLPSPSDTAEIEAGRRQGRWWMSLHYQTLDVRSLLLSRCERPDEIARVNLEMDLFEANEMLPVLRMMCFLVDRWRETGVLWGVGRGSSVASYCLFLLHVHRIDSLAYDLPISEFLR